MKTNFNGPEWEKTLEEIIFDSYLDYRAPATFYIRDCVPQGLINHIDAALWDKYARPLLYVNNTGNPDIGLQDRDFLLFTPQGIVTRTAKTEKIRKWEKIAAMYAASQAKYDETRWPELADVVAKKLADSLAGEIVDDDTRELMPRLLRRIVRVVLGIDEPQSVPLPYLPVPPLAEDDAMPSSQPSEDMTITTDDDKYEVDF